MSGSEEQQLAGGALLGRAQPNPFNGMTNIAFAMPTGGGHAVLEVFDASGRLVQTLVDGQQSAGNRVVSWDGTDVSGNRVASGVYYYQLRVDDESATRRVILMR
jgi:flagellar hook assembly protein FlgD